MYKANASKFKSIYKNKVLPKKSVTENTKAVFEKSIEILEDYAYYRSRANDLILGGNTNGEETPKP